MTLVSVAAVFWSGACVNHREEEPTAAAASDAGSPPAARPSPVEEYIQFVATAGDPRPSLSDDQMAEGLRKLAGALGTLNAATPDLLIDLRVGAEHIVLNPASTETTAVIRDALVAAAGSMERTETDGPLRRAAESITTDRPLIEQHGTVFQFFQRAADALERRTSVTSD